MKSIRVLSVEDHGVVGDWLASRIEEEGINYLGRIDRADEVLHEVRERDANLVVMDVSMPGVDPFAACDDLRRAAPDVNVMFLTASKRTNHVDQALRSGATGYFSKADDPEEIVEGLLTVSDGRIAFGSSVLEECPSLRNLQGKRRTAISESDLKHDAKLSALTPREHEVLRLLGRGLSRSDIARIIHRSPKTVDKHRTSVMSKLDIHDRAELVLFAVREGVVEP